MRSNGYLQTEDYVDMETIVFKEKTIRSSDYFSNRRLRRYRNDYLQIEDYVFGNDTKSIRRPKDSNDYLQAEDIRRKEIWQGLSSNRRLYDVYNIKSYAIMVNHRDGSCNFVE